MTALDKYHGAARPRSRVSALAVSLVFALLPFVAAPVHAGEELPWFKASFLDLRDDIREAAEANKRLILYFSQAGCPYCKKLLEVNLGDPRIAAATQKQFDVVALDIHGAREVIGSDGKPRSEKEFAAFMKVRGTPTLIVLDEESKIALRIDGYYPPAEFSAALDHAANSREKQTGFDAYLKGETTGGETGP